MLNYNAEFLTENEEKELLDNLESKTLEDFDEYFYRDDLMFGNHNEANSFTGFKMYLTNKGILDEVVTNATNKILNAYEYTELFIPSAEMKNVYEKLENIDVRANDDFIKDMITIFRKEMGYPAYADEIEKDGRDEDYYEMFESFRFYIKKAVENKYALIMRVLF